MYSNQDKFKKYDTQWGGYRINSGRKHNWPKENYPLSSMQLPRDLKKILIQLRDEKIPVKDIIAKLQELNDEQSI
jgi:hypothetical protein